LLDGHRPNRTVAFTKAVNVVTRPLFQTYAVGVFRKDQPQDTHAVIDKGNRVLFITPWRHRSIIGTTYAAYDGDPDDCRVTEGDVQNLLGEINRACPSAGLERDEVSFAHGGLLPSSGVRLRAGGLRLMKQYQIYDHRDEGARGLMSVVGVKYTTARQVAEEVVDRVFESRGQKPAKSVSSITPLYGGQIEHFETFLRAAIGKRPGGLGEEAVRHLVYNYGSAYPEVLKYLDRPADGGQTLTARHALLKAETVHGIREEMAQKLGDVAFGRTDLCTAGHPGDEALGACARVMGAELGWSPAKARQELQEVTDRLSIRQ
jgi:glycerol-3-phosphate dehydrogenase